EGIWRTRFFANGQLQSAGRNRSPLRINVGLRKRASFDRDSRVAVVWNTGAKAEVAAEISDRRATRRIRAHRKGSRIGCGKCADAGPPERGRLALCFERRKTLHHERGDR